MPILPKGHWVPPSTIETAAKLKADTGLSFWDIMEMMDPGGVMGPVGQIKAMDPRAAAEVAKAARRFPNIMRRVAKLPETVFVKSDPRLATIGLYEQLSGIPTISFRPQNITRATLPHEMLHHLAYRKPASTLYATAEKLVNKLSADEWGDMVLTLADRNYRVWEMTPHEMADEFIAISATEPQQFKKLLSRNVAGKQESRLPRLVDEIAKGASPTKSPVSKVVNKTEFGGIRKTSLMGPQDEMLVATGKKGEDIGYLWVTKEPGGFSVRKVEVLPGYQRQGVATSLYKKASSLYGKYVGSTARTSQGEALARGIGLKTKLGVKTYEQAQKAVDDKIDDLMKRGLSWEQADVHPEVEALYKIRDSIGQADLEMNYKSVFDLVRKHSGSDAIADDIVKRIYELNPLGSTGQYMAGQYTMKQITNRKDTLQKILNTIMTDYGRTHGLDMEGLFGPTSGLTPQGQIDLLKRFAKQARAIEESVYKYVKR